MLTAKRKQLDEKVATLKEDLRVKLAHKERVLQEWNRAWGGVDNATAALDAANDAVRDAFEELCKARDEQLGIVPKPREAAD